MILIIFTFFTVQGAFLDKSFSTQITQSFKSSLSGKIRTSPGTIKYKFPSNIKIEIQGKSPLTFVSNPKKTWFYRPPFDESEKGEVQIQYSQKSSLSQFFDALKKGLKSNNHYNVKLLKLKALLTFKEKMSKELRIKKATLVFKKTPLHFKNVKKIQLLYTDKRKVDIFLSHFKNNPQFSSQEFEFKVPSNTNIVQ